MTSTQARILIGLLSVVVLILGGAALRATYIVSMPLVFAFFVTVLVWPVNVAVQRRVPQRLWWLGIIVCMALVILVLAGFIGGATLVVWNAVADRLPEYQQQLQEHWNELNQWLRQRDLPAADEGDGLDIATYAAGWASTFALSTLGLITVLVMVIFFTLLMLIEAEHWKQKAKVSMTAPNAATLADAVAATARQVRAFILMQALISFLTATATGLWLWIMGVPLVLLWTFLVFLADFVPNAGPIVAVAFMSVVALVTLGWGAALVTVLGLTVIQQLFGNFIHPVLMGHRLAISPLVVLISVIFWTWIWGPAGAVLAVPITATLIIALAHVPALHPIGLMLGRTANQQKFDAQTHAGKQP